MGEYAEEHTGGWLQQYYDGELNEQQAARFEAHLEGCPACRMELERLNALTSLLQSVPAPAPVVPADAFAARLTARLEGPPQLSRASRFLQAAWRAVPFVWIGGWLFSQTVLTVVGLLTFFGVEESLGLGRAARLFFWNLLPEISALFLIDDTVSRLSWLAPFENIVNLGAWEAAVTLVMALGLWGWVVSWGLRQKQMKQDEPLFDSEG